MEDILKTDIGLLFGLINERNNQYEDSKKEKNDDVIVGNANMLMNM